MGVSCDLEVDVNGDEVFMVNKDVISMYSGHIRKLFTKSKVVTGNLKVIFNDFPGGAESFEHMIRFCYNKGKIDVNPFNVSILYCVGNFLEMDQSVCGTENLLELTEKSLKEMRYWSWGELVVALKLCQGLVPISCTSGLTHKCLDSVVGMIASPCEPSPCPSTSSPDSPGCRQSFDTRSTESLKNSSSRATWWFEDLVFLEPLLVNMLVKSMVSRNFDHCFISRFLFYYQKARFAKATSDEKCKIMEAIVEMLYSLEPCAVLCKNLFVLLRGTINLKLSASCQNKLESLIGFQLDQATLDNLLVSSPAGTKYMYDVNLALRFVKSFLSKGACYLPLSRLKRVGTLMDLFLAEVAPDPHLKPAKFLALVRSLPDSARDSYDGLYHAIDIYLEVHSGLSEEEKIVVCSGLNFEKMSSEACDQLAKNTKYPLQTAKRALIAQQRRLQNLLLETDQLKTFVQSPCSLPERGSDRKKISSCDQIVLYAGKLNVPLENEKLKTQLQGMQYRALELEKICRRMQIQMTKIMKARIDSHTKAKSLAKLCS